MQKLFGKHMPGHIEKGFTLIETMIAMAILAIGLLAVASMQITAFQGNRAARLQTEAVALAAQQLEELGALPYDDARLASGSHSESGVGPAGQYDLEWQIAPDSPLPETKTITLTVGWNSRGGQRNAEFNHIIADI